MRAIRFHYRPVRYLATRAVSRRMPTAGLGRFGFVRLDEVEPPALPGPDWVRLDSRLSGICGSDLNVITAHDSFTLEPFGAYPFTFGHEVVATVAETGPAVTRWAPGDRVIVSPMLACRQRGKPPCGACARGAYGLCRRVGEGVGSMTGFSTLTGGGWSPSLVAHESQLHPQGNLPDEVAVLTDPFASAAKGVIMEPPGEDDTVLVIGAGTIGLLTVSALRLTGWTGAIAVSARYDFQAERARRAGADTILRTRDDLFRWAESMPEADAYDPTLAPRFVEGGPSLVYDTVGSQGTVQDALSLVREGGRLVMVGAAGKLSADWTRIWNRQIRVAGIFAYGAVPWQGEDRDIYDVSLELIRGGDLKDLGLLTHVFELEEYRDAIAVALGKSGSGSIKVAFRPGA
ncbi:MAG TPA: alcohol dehydrogenase catalytic domain-containing protein [Longimicrobiales bacterium]|nr:alcohol dehydrogenase catalytic domain-containing protein [Longimicrobiales bacterium]